MKTKTTVLLIFISIFYFSTFSFTSKATNTQYNYVELNRDEILNSTSSSFSSNTFVRWNEFRQSWKDYNDGIIPSQLLDDAVYCSMNLPSESQSDYMISVNRDNAHIIGDTSAPEIQKAVAMGGLYTSTGEVLPDNFSVYLGKIVLYAFSKSENTWVVIDSQPYPVGIAIFTLPWKNSKSTYCQNIEYTDEYAKINLTGEEMSNNVLHFWGGKVPINKEDYLFYASAYSFWVSDSAENKLTAVGGIDAKAATGTNTIVQLYSSRGLSSSCTRKILWGHTVPNAQYSDYNTSILNQMY